MAKEASTTMLGIPSKQDVLLQRGQADTVPATVTNSQGLPSGQAQISEGEFVFSVPAIMALGEGDYEKGLSMLTQIHDMLKAKAQEMFGQRATPQGAGLAALQ